MQPTFGRSRSHHCQTTNPFGESPESSASQGRASINRSGSKDSPVQPDLMWPDSRRAHTLSPTTNLPPPTLPVGRTGGSVPLAKKFVNPNELPIDLSSTVRKYRLRRSNSEVDEEFSAEAKMHFRRERSLRLKNLLNVINPKQTKE